MSILNNLWQGIQEWSGAVPKSQNNYAYSQPAYQDYVKSAINQVNATLPQTASVASAPNNATADPYAKYGGTAAYNSLVSGFNAQKGNIYGTANEAAANAGIGLNSSILDLLSALKSGQSKIDQQAVQNELAKKQGTAGVLGMVGRGIKSGGVTLANKNASNSSASEALARAYGDIGRRQLSSVGNQYAQGQDAVATAQADFEQQRAGQIRHIGENKAQVVNNIVADARDKLAALDGQIASANLPNRINIEQEKEAIRQAALNQLQQYDQALSQGVAGINPTSIDARRGKAAELANAGTAPENAFNYTTQTPVQFQDTGPFASGLPIFISNRSRRQQ